MYLLPFFLIPFAIFFVSLRLGRGFLRDNRRDERLPWSGGRGVSGPYDHYFDRDEARRRKLEARIFKIAYRLKGRITVSDIVVDTGVTVQEAEETVQGMVDNSRVRMEVDDRGLVFYEFPEILSRFND